MGIRCYCPNGHPLNVKEHLAGQRGICPRCGLSFTIPTPEVPTPPPPPAPTTDRVSPPPLPSRRVSPEKVSYEIDQPFDTDRVPRLEPDSIVTDSDDDVDELSIVVVEPELRNVTTLRKLGKKHARMATTFVLGVVALALIIALVLVLVLF